MEKVTISNKFFSVLIVVIFMNCAETKNETAVTKLHYEPTWESLSQWEVPQWFDDAVLGIYCHWGIYSVPGFRFKSGSEQVDSGLWYGWFMYVPNDAEQPNFGVYDYHKKTYGDPCEFGYHEFVPMFKAEKWDPDAWAELYKQAGADFAGLAAEHADGFVLWDSEYDEFNAMDKGPHRDLLGELFNAARKVGLKTVATFHELFSIYNTIRLGDQLLKCAGEPEPVTFERVNRERLSIRYLV